MTTVELILQIIAFGLALWLGLYLLSRNLTDRRLLLAGLGLIFYAIGLALDLLARFAPESWWVVWQRPFLYLPALFWLLLLIQLARDERPWPDRLRRQPRTVGLALAGAIFFGLGFSTFLFSVDWLPRVWLLLGIGVDLLLLGTAVAFFDGQVALVMVFSTGVTFPMLLLLLTTISAAIIVQVFANAAQTVADQIAFSPFPRIRQQRSDLRAAADAVQRIDDALDLITLDDAEFARLTRRALSHMGNLPRLAASPLTRLPLIDARLQTKDIVPDTLARAAELKSVLTESIARLKPAEQGDFGSSDAWRYYNALYFPYVVGLKPYSRRNHHDDGDTAVQQASDWFRAEVPQRTLYNWQTAAAQLIAQDLR